MAVYYRYRSGVDTFSVPVETPSISVANLKRLILGTSRHGHGRTRGRGPRENVALSDARTGEEYTDDGALVPRSSTVVVRRVAGPPAETITVAPSAPPPKAAQQDSDGKSCSSAEDDEDKAISAVIDAAQLTWEGHRPSQGWRRYDGRRGAQEQIAPPAGYVCHRCRVPGHFIQHCPTNGDPRFDFGSRASSTANLPAPEPESTVPDDGVPPELHCKICKKVMADAVVTGRCCFDSFCNACIRGHVVATSKCVCGAQARADDLIPNQTLRTTITNMLPTRAAAGASVGIGTDKQRSSAGSNAKPTSQSPSASQESRSHVTAACSEHSDNGSASSTSKSAAREPRTKQTTAESPHQSMACPEQFGYGGPFGPACYDPFFGGMGMPWAPDPYAYYGVPCGGVYPIVPVPTGYHDGGHGRKRTTGRDDRRLEEPGVKRRCGSRSAIAV
ncbi:hypothetical protein EJB05_06744, partial [Eragrostis curvula]